MTGDPSKTYANPYIVCDYCKQQVTWHEDVNLPCGHHAGFTSVCPSWSPVDGCTCQDHFGYVSHGPAPGVAS